MTPHQIHLIRSSFEPLKPLAATVAEAFYARLFARDPALRALFRGGDMGEQGGRLMQMLAAATGNSATRLAPVAGHSALTKTAELLVLLAIRSTSASSRPL